MSEGSSLRFNSTRWYIDGRPISRGNSAHPLDNRDRILRRCPRNRDDERENTAPDRAPNFASRDGVKTERRATRDGKGGEGRREMHDNRRRGIDADAGIGFHGRCRLTGNYRPRVGDPNRSLEYRIRIEMSRRVVRIDTPP